ncbi:EAL domain-containing protein [Salinarimonas sp.]|uniref:EAL domain-containing protein n=1 Tax=Salinarimonas sp. TaxID=2766526 RepID=UPI0032D92492
MRRRLLFGLVMVLGFAGAAGAFHFAHASFVRAANERQLEEIVAQVVTRTEVAVDLAVIQLGELMAAGLTRCDGASLTAIRRAAFSVGSLKDVHVIAPDAHCSGFGEAALVDRARVREGVRHPGRNRNIALARIVDPDWRGLGVAWNLGGSELVAVMTTDALLFDMLPGPLREHAAITLSVAPGREVARYAPMGWEAEGAGIGADALARFDARSARYPLFVDVAVAPAALAAWNRESRPLFTIAGLLFAALFGFLLARAMAPPRSEVDALDAAFARGAIIPFVQPIVALGTHRIVGFEILARWVERDGTVIPPARFIPLVESSGRSDRLLETLLHGVGESLGPILRARPDLKATINAAPDQFVADGFPQRLAAMLEAAGVPPSSLVVEITERREIASPEAARATVAALRAVGIGVAIDDAGTGHNGLATIQGLGATILKVDKLFVDRIDADHRTRSLVEMLVQVARDFEMTLVAEGIERPEQAAALLAIGVREGQGYLFARPMPAGAFPAALAAEAPEPARPAPAALRLSA